MLPLVQSPLKVQCGRQASLHSDPLIECNALGNSPTILRCAKPSLLLRDYANYMKPGSSCGFSATWWLRSLHYPVLSRGFFFSPHQLSLPLHRLSQLSTTSSTEYCWTTGITTRAGPQAGTSCHQKMGDLNLSLTEECAEVFCICPANPPNSSSSSDSVSLLTSCVPSNTIFISHISGLSY
jgi:hypothetical protein